MMGGQKEEGKRKEISRKTRKFIIAASATATATVAFWVLGSEGRELGEGSCTHTHTQMMALAVFSRV